MVYWICCVTRTLFWDREIRSCLIYKYEMLMGIFQICSTLESVVHFTYRRDVRFHCEIQNMTVINSHKYHYAFNSWMNDCSSQNEGTIHFCLWLSCFVGFFLFIYLNSSIQLLRLIKSFTRSQVSRYCRHRSLSFTISSVGYGKR